MPKPSVYFSVFQYFWAGLSAWFTYHIWDIPDAPTWFPAIYLIYVVVMARWAFRVYFRPNVDPVLLPGMITSQAVFGIFFLMLSLHVITNTDAALNEATALVLPPYHAADLLYLFLELALIGVVGGLFGQLFVHAVSSDLKRKRYSYLRYAATIGATLALFLLVAETSHAFEDMSLSAAFDIVIWGLCAYTVGRVCWNRAGL